jgi:hypothetical protein
MFPFEIYRALGATEHSILYVAAAVSIVLGLLVGFGVEYAKSFQRKSPFSKSKCLFNFAFAAAVLFAFHYGALMNEAKFAHISGTAA